VKLFKQIGLNKILSKAQKFWYPLVWVVYHPWLEHILCGNIVRNITIF